MLILSTIFLVNVYIVITEGDRKWEVIPKNWWELGGWPQNRDFIGCGRLVRQTGGWEVGSWPSNQVGDGCLRPLPHLLSFIVNLCYCPPYCMIAGQMFCVQMFCVLVIVAWTESWKCVSLGRTVLMTWFILSGPSVGALLTLSLQVMGQFLINL